METGAYRSYNLAFQIINQPDATLQLLSSWWWAWGRPKHVEPYIRVNVK